MRKKLVTMILVISLVSALFAGCGNSSSPGETGEKDSTTQQDDSNEASDDNEVSDSNFNETGYPIVNEQITLKILIGVRDGDSLMDISEMDSIKELEEKTNIHLEWEVIKGADWDTKINLMFASGEYPDIILSSQTTLDYEEYGVTQKLVLPLDDLIDQYMPNYVERTELEESDPLVGLVASDGNVYTVGYMMAQKINTNVHYFMNQTWLDALGLSTPTTWEEFNDVLRAFKTQDPNGNGEADEVPIELGVDTGFYGVRYYLPLFGIPCDGDDWMYIDESGNVQFAPTSEGFRSCMEWLNMLYEEDLLDPEIISQDLVTIESKLAEGNVGFTTAWRLTNMGFDDGIAKDLTIFMPVASDGYEVSMYKTIELANDGAYVTITNEHVPETMRLLDAMLETETMFDLFIDNEYWDYNEDGLIETYDTDPSQVLTALNVNTLFYAPGEYYASVYQMASHRIEKTEYCQLYTDAGFMQTNSNDLFKVAPRTSDEISRTTLLQTDIDNAVTENISKFITSGVTDSTWDEFVSLFDSMSVDEYISIYQNAIDQLDK